MTREKEASKTLTQYIDYDAETPDYYEMEKACKVAIKVLEQIPDLKKAYNKGYKDGQEALAYHIELCKEEAEPCNSIINTIDFAIDATTGKDNYSVGMRNGMKYVKSLINGKEPDYDNCEKQEPCEDCISRAEAIKAIRNYNVTIEVGRTIGKSQLVDIVDSINKVQEKMISELPSVQPKPKTGHWIEEKSEVYKCSNCGRYALEWGGKLKMSRYCPDCGVKMLLTDLEKAESEGKE